MVNKELKLQKNARSNKEADDKMISSKETSLIKKDTPNPRNGTASVSAPSPTSDTTQVVTSALLFKSDQDPGSREDLSRRILP